MNAIVQRGNGCGTPVKENNGDRWCFDDVVLWIGRRQNGDAIEWCEK
jgi:hypothetical protein